MDVRFTPSHRGGSGPPMVLLHGFTDTWRTWELVLPALERQFTVLAPTLPGHAGGPPLPAPLSNDSFLDAVEALLDDAGVQRAHLVGNSLGGYLALRLAERDRALSVVALAPAGGWVAGDNALRTTRAHFLTMEDLLKTAAPHADAIVSSPEGRRRATEILTVAYDHIPPELIAHQIVGAAGCVAVRPLVEISLRDGYPHDAEQITCPVRFVWGTEDRLLAWPRSAAAFQASLPQADWVVLDDVGHSPQLDVPLVTAELILGWATGRVEAA